MTPAFKNRLEQLASEAYQQLIDTPNEIDGMGNGVFDRYKNPVLTAAHAPASLEVRPGPRYQPLSDGTFRHQRCV
jgi:4-O-beta-D-mannosyl-D-glucose phosphorylase